MPAPFGPMTAWMPARRHGQRHLGQRRHAAEGQARLLHLEQRRSPLPVPVAVTVPVAPLACPCPCRCPCRLVPAPVPASRPPRRQRADHAGRQPVDRTHQEAAVEDQPVVGETRQELGQEREGDAARHRARHAALAAEEERQQEQDGRLEREAVRRDVAVEKCEQAARRAGEAGRHREGHDPDIVGRQPERLGRHVAPLHRQEGAAPRRAAQVRHQPERERRRRP